MMTRILTYLLLCSLAPAGALAAAEINFTASVDQSTVGLGDQFTLNLTINGEDISSVPRPELPDLADFNLLGQTQSSSTNIQIVNGQMKKQATVNFIYALSAKQLGTAMIPACKLSYGGKHYQSQPIEITVVKASQTQGRPQPMAPGRPAPEPGFAVGDNLQLAATADRRTVYVGEQVTLEYSLLTRIQLGDINVAEMPSFSGFWTEKIFDAEKVSFTRRTVGGREYNAFLLKQVALFPMSAGEVSVKPIALNVAVVRPPRDFFDMFGTSQVVRIESKPITVAVLPLPEGKPVGFSGGVGQFSVSSSLDRTATSGSEPFNLTIKLSGTGNIRLIEKPAIPPVPGLKILDPEVKEDIRAAGGRIKGTRTFRYPIIPQADGRFVIPAVSIAYFDPAAKAYRTASTERYECTATGCDQSASVVEATGLKVLGTDINYIKPDAAALRAYPTGPSRWLWAAYLLSLGLVGGSFWLRGYRERLASDRGFARKARSSALVRKRLKASVALLKQNDLPAFHAALARAVAGYAGDRFDLDTQAMTKEQLRDELFARSIPEMTVAEIVTVLEQCELARFSPGMLTVKDPAGLLARAKAALDRI